MPRLGVEGEFERGVSGGVGVEGGLWGGVRSGERGGIGLGSEEDRDAFCLVVLKSAGDLLR
jgi:hypothetical protein